MQLPDRTRPLPRFGAAGVSLAPVDLLPARSGAAASSRLHIQGSEVAELTGSGRADAAAGVFFGAEHAVHGPILAHPAILSATSDNRGAGQPCDGTDRESESRTDGEGALVLAGGAAFGACVVIAIMFAVAVWA